MWTLLRCALRKFLDDAMPTYASALAFSVVFSVFPFAMFLLALLGTLNAGGLFDWLRGQAALVVPGEAMRAVDRVLAEIQRPEGALLSIGAVLALWSASGGVRSAMDAMNVAYSVDEARPTWKRLLVSVAYTIALAAILIVVAAGMALGAGAAEWIASQVGLGPLVVLLLYLFISAAVLLFGAELNAAWEGYADPSATRPSAAGPSATAGSARPSPDRAASPSPDRRRVRP